MNADLLRRAADKLRETRAEVETGPPWAVAEDAPGVVCSGDLRTWGAPTVAQRLDEGDADWIALASPALAEPLAAWLEFEAGLMVDMTAARFGEVALAARFAPTLAVARAILGETS